MRLIWIGRTKNEHLRALVDEYLKRLNRFTPCEVAELREGAGRDAACEVRAEEGARILQALRPGELTVLLDVEGRQWSSPELAAEIENWQARGTKAVAFVIGGHYGVAPEVKARADIRWSLSRLTLTHEMARVVLAEQLYRAYTIMRGLPYQK